MGIRRILIIQTAFVGDLLLGIPLLKRLRRLDPTARLSLYCRKGLGDFLLQAGLIDEVIEADKSSASSRRDAFRRLRGVSWDLVICPHQSPRTHLLVARLRASRKIGYRTRWNSLFFETRVSRPMALPEALRQLALIADLDREVREGLAEISARVTREGLSELQSLSARQLSDVPDWASMSVEPLLELRNAAVSGDADRVLALLAPKAAKFVATHGLYERTLSRTTRPRLVILAPGSVWPTKMWREEGYRECAENFARAGYRTVFAGAPGERGLCDRLAEGIPGAVVMAGETSLWESTQVFALSDAMICNDSGSMHMAAAAGLPSVAVFGPTTLALGYRPWQNSARVLQVELGCRPCGKHGSERCPLGTHDCMKRVPAQTVYDEALALLGNASDRGAVP